MTRRSRAGTKGQDEAQAQAAPKGKMWPLYVIGGLIAAALVATMVLKENTRTGDIGLGGHCESTQDCRDRRDICWREHGRGTCTRTCGSDTNACMPGTTCQTIGTAKGRRSLRVQKLCLED